MKGARIVEMDVRRSADGVWIVFHDPALKRTTGRRGRLERVSWDTLSCLDAGSWFSSRFEGERIPRIEQVLDFCRRKGVKAFLDVKVIERERELVQALRASGGLNRVWIGAGTLHSLRRWRRLLGGRPLFWVTGFRAPVTAGRVHQARRLKLAGIVAYKRWATRAAVKRTHQAGLKLFVWTARRPKEIKRLALLGVDGIMSEVWPAPPLSDSR